MNRFSVCVLIGIAMWVAVIKSCAHAMLPGVRIPCGVRLRDPNHKSPRKCLESDQHPPVAFAFMPTFAVVNAGLSLNAGGRWRPYRTSNGGRSVWAASGQSDLRAPDHRRGHGTRPDEASQGNRLAVDGQHGHPVCHRHCVSLSIVGLAFQHFGKAPASSPPRRWTSTWQRLIRRSR